ncbi:MAG TPA: DNA translocase FtsK 4TM domain-containing protein [Byssovorax sp.]|jgi:S-DNA-T family DNA segregation ATPase FtsK/SpoIIIE
MPFPLAALFSRAAAFPKEIEAAAPSEPPRSPDAPRSRAHGYAREAASLVLFAASLYAGLALASFRADPMRPEIVGADWVGPVGEACARAAVEGIGVAAWFVPIELALLALPLVNGKPSRFGLTRLAGDLLVLVVLAALVHVAAPKAAAFGAMPLGGAIGELFGEVMRSLFSTLGSYLIGTTIVALILLGRAAFSFIEWVQRVERGAVIVGEHGLGGVRALLGAWITARDIDRERARVEKQKAEPTIVADEPRDAIIAALADDDVEAAAPPAVAITTSDFATPSPRLVADDSTPDPTPLEAAVTPAEPKRGRKKRAALDAVLDDTRAPVIDPADVPTPSPILPVAAPATRRAKAPKIEEPKIVDTSAALATEKAEIVRVVPAIGCGFRLPSTEMLEAAAVNKIQIDGERLKETAQQLEKVLSDYRVSGKVEEIHPGPTVTTFEVSPVAGTKVSKVAGLADDLALGLSRKVRIIAPIPGKNRIGFEVPNEHRIPVCLRELVEDRRFVEMKAPLPCVLGRDIIGTPYFADLASMPHVIVAGATGAGKSVGLNVMLVSLLFRKTPAELRLLMIDPKVVELAPFDRIPHMLLPVVTDMKQASNALKWAVDEMERRYQLFANAGTKNITTYNGWVERVLKGEVKPPRPKKDATVAAIAPDGTEVEVPIAKDGTDVEMPEKLPFIVIVVDEFADLMMQQGKDVEVSVARLAQKARAAGMHVILATQRPSVDVITGMIKANFPTRIAFRVAQKVDSRTILDEQGAEHLLGRGDMLVKMNGANDTRRVQCPFCSEEEVQRITDFLRLQGEPVYDEAILKPRDEDGDEAPEEDAETDAMYDAAVRIVADTRRCSTSWLQRKLGIGYNRAAKIVESMERRGLVGPANGAKDREVLISSL